MILRPIKTLETINDKAEDEFWKEVKNGMNSVERNLTVDPFHACSLRAGAALLARPPLAAGCADHSGCNDLRQSLSCGMFVAAV